MVDFVKLKDEGEIPEKEEIKIKKRRKISFKRIFIILLILFLISSIISSINYSMASKIAVVPINSVILTEKTNSLYGSSISSREISNIIYNLGNDNSVKAIILDINSPGGSPVAAEEISKAINKVKLKKPIYALINDLGASGAFWVAVSTNKIYASSMSIVGSIGVTSAGLGFENFIKDYNITYRQQISGKMKDIGSPFKKPTKEEKALIQNLLDNIHSKFISHVANSRNLSYNYVKNYSNGEVFTGDKAKKIGFIDKIGYMPDVISDLEKNLSLNKNTLIINSNPPLTFFQKLGTSALNYFSPSLKSNLIMLQ